MNWKQEAIEHLQKYDAMVQAVETIPTELARLKLVSQGMSAVKPDVPRVRITPRLGDDRLIDSIIQQRALEKSYENARLWVTATDQALSALPPEEKLILYRMYVRPERGVIPELCETLGVEQSSIYRRRDAALFRFTLALYGAA